MEEQRLQKRKRKAQQENNKISLVSACTDLAEIYRNRGEYRRAIEEYEVISEVYEAEKDLIEYARVKRGIGEAYLGLHDFRKALEYHQVYLDIAVRQNDEVEKQRAHATIGHTYLTWYLETQTERDNNLNNANKHFMKSLSIAEKLTHASKVEKADMMSRLLSNLGVVNDCLGNTEKAMRLFERSIKICIENDIYEQLSRGHLSMASLFEKKGDSNEAIRHFNLAIDATKKLKGNERILMMCAALQAKSEALIKLSDFHGAKQVLLKAYKLNTPNLEERKTIEGNLKIVASMCQTEDKLVASSGDDKEMKRLYETMGDRACSLKNYSKAIEYYKLMLRHAERCLTLRELAPCYYSLAETFKDNGQYEEAVGYYEKEYSCCEKLQDNLNTLSRIADMKEAAGASMEEVKTVYERAFKNCRDDGNVREEYRMVNRCIEYLKRNSHHLEASKLEQYLEGLEHFSDLSDFESEDSEPKDTDIDINLNEITDVSDDSDFENGQLETVVGKRKPKSFTIRKNLKGETQLHVACINGSLPVVKHLLEQGHPVNVRDHTGWLPLHEASNHGHYEIVRMLLEKGAAINDRGGTLCNGVTPLYDAANNGHLKVVRLLLDRGACPTVKTDDGDTPLNILKVWHSKNPFVGEDLVLYRNIIKRMSEAMERVVQTGKNVPSNRPSLEGRRAPFEENNPFEVQTGKERVAHQLTGRNRVLDLDEEIGSTSGHVEEYQRAMSNLKRRSAESTTPVTKYVDKRPSLVVSDEEVIDDWLDDDVSRVSKRRKIGSVEDLFTTSGIRGKVSGTKRTRSFSRTPPTNDDIFIVPDDFETEPIEASPIKRSPLPGNSRKTQTSLLDAGFSRCRPEPSSTSQNSLRRYSSSEHLQPTISRNYTECDSTIVTPTPVANSDLMVYIDVKIDEKVFRVPIFLSQVHSNTIGWLAKQAASKYAKKEGAKLKLELETTTGALLSDEDPLELLFPLGALQAEPVVGKIVKLSLPPLVERYREVCSQMDTGVDDILCQTLDELSISLDLRNKAFPNKSLSSLCKALNHQATLHELILSGNYLDSECVKQLCLSLPSLTNLSTLNLRRTGLASNHLAEIARTFRSSPQALRSLRRLDLSDNPLRDKSLRYLSEITKCVELSSLALSNVKFTNDLFEEYECDMGLRSLENLDVSNNVLGGKVVRRIIEWTDPLKLRELDMSNTRCGEGTLTHIVRYFETFQSLQLEHINLKRCDIQQNEVQELLWMSSNRRLKSIDLSYNRSLTGITLRRLLECPTMQNITLVGCHEILNYFEKGYDFLQGSNVRTLKLSADLQKYSTELGILVDGFENKFKQNCYVEIDGCFVMLSSKMLDTN